MTNKTSVFIVEMYGGGQSRIIKVFKRERDAVDFCDAAFKRVRVGKSDLIWEKSGSSYQIVERTCH